MTNTTYADSGESIFTVVSRLAKRHGAVDLGQGYPGYNPSEVLTDKLQEISNKVSNHQYASPNGCQELRVQVSRMYKQIYNLNYRAGSEITITSGATEGINSALMGLINPGDELICFEPIYDQYIPVARRAGARVQVLSLEESTFEIPLERLRSRVSPDTDYIILNNPHNPTGKVYERSTLEELVKIAITNDVQLLSDEVYEHLVFENNSHVPLASLEGARERTLTFGSSGKSFDATGWKIGWALGPPDMSKALRRAHQFTTYCTATPLQQAMTEFMKTLTFKSFFEKLRNEYTLRRSALQDGLTNSDFVVLAGKGSYFLPARIDTDETIPGTPVQQVEWIIDRYGVASVPMSAFYPESDRGRNVFRFAFCKELDELKQAAKQLSRN